MGLAVLGCALVGFPLVGCATPDVSAPAVPSSSVPSSSSVAPTTSPVAAAPLYVERVQWVDTAKGRTLRVYPSAAGRAAASTAAGTAAWAEVVAAAPGADTASLHDQFRCHWELARLFEPAKPSWNLEQWRPDVGYRATVDAECNPGGPE